MKQYLASSDTINYHYPAVASLAKTLRADATGDKSQDSAIAKRCFEWVRDNIKHSADYQLTPVTCSASDTLEHGTGLCYAKSHLLAALLRANDIPCGFCYQRLSTFENGAPYCLHGFNAVYLNDFGWYPVDPRGNKAGIDAQFSPPHIKLAFTLNDEKEATFPEIWPEPLPIITDALNTSSDIEYLYQNLPDIEWIKVNG